MDQILDWGLTGRKMVRLHFAHKCAHAYTGTHPRNCNLVLQNKHIIHPQGNDGKIYHFCISFSGPKVNDNLVCVLAKWHFHSCKNGHFCSKSWQLDTPVCTLGDREEKGYNSMCPWDVQGFILSRDSVGTASHHLNECKGTGAAML